MPVSFHDDAVAADPKHRRATLGKLADLLDRQGIDVEDIGRVTKIKAWQGFYKDESGKSQTVDMVGLQFSPVWEDGPQWPVIQPGPVVRLPARKAKPAKPGGLPIAMVGPDMQIGYFRNRAGDLEPTHDERAISVFIEAVRAAQPTRIILVGDNGDLPEFGKYRLTPPFQQTTQATIDRMTLLCAQLRDAAPDAEIVWLAGNHEERLPNYILDNAAAAFGLRQGNRPDSWPVLSVPFLCRMDDYGVEYKPGYPASAVWVNQRLRVIHGHITRSSRTSSTAKAYVESEKTSVIFGHTHRLEWSEKTRRDHDGPRRILAMSPGCLARIDGVVPSTKQGTDLDGRPLPITEDWQQGFAVVTYEPGDGRFWPELVPINNGTAMWRGRLIESAPSNE